MAKRITRLTWWHVAGYRGGGGRGRGLRERLAPDANIHLLGFVPGGPALIEQADLVVISSQAFESFGLTAVEAMIRGVPVVATRVGGLPEVVGEAGEGGYVVALDEPRLRRADCRVAGRSCVASAGGRARTVARERALHRRKDGRGSDALLSAGSPSELGEGVGEGPRGEWHFIARRLAEPVIAVGAAGMAVSAVARRLGNRLLRDRRRHYPPHIRALADAVETPAGELAPVSPGELSAGPRELKLAVGHLSFDGWPRWESAFDDHEQFVSSSLNWLLHALTTIAAC